MVEARGLWKRYGDVAAVDGIDFSVGEGELFGLLGPNGAGKTTTISMLACLIAPTSGTIVVDGHDCLTEPMAVKRTLGIVPQEVALYPTLSAAQNLAFWGRMYGLRGASLRSAVDEALELVGLAERAHERIERYSGGMKRRVNIAAGILHRPRVLLMDEPTVGIDPQSRNHILETVRRLNDDGVTVVYTSHYMEEVEALCDRVAIMDHGKIIASGTVRELSDLVGGLDVITVVADGASEADAAALKGCEGIAEADVSDDGLRLLAPRGGSALASVVRMLEGRGVRIRSLTVTEPDLESVFLHLTGKTLRD
ncbi:MAG: ABC transporter ATP-binding protein [Coriobacteriia bacterium]|nr:ABC transporter ATP-binding protein [Coriobacteriia bacterium]